jgi:endonuclease G
MMLDTQRFQDSLDRSRGLGLEKTITRLRDREDERIGSQRAIEQRRTTLLREVDDPTAANLRLERILQGNELTDINYLALGALCARSVCRISLRRNNRLIGYGTGFLVAPGILMTNHHVLPTVADVKESVAEFRYERDVTGADLEPVVFALKTIPEPIIFQDLDFALVAVEGRSAGGEPLDQFGWLKLNILPNKALIGEYLTIIQHPDGERKQVCVRENKLIKYSENGPYLWYQTDTVGGSSGSPVFNNSWEVVALHHSGVPRTRREGGKDVWLAKNGKKWDATMGDEEIDWIANEGVRISRIAQYLSVEKANHPIAQAVKAAGEPRLGEGVVARPTGGPDGIQIETLPGGRRRILVPIDIDVNVGSAPRNPDAAMRDSSPSPAVDTAGPRVVEKVVIDQDTYGKRNGYNPKYLGAGAQVPLPKVKAAKNTILMVKGKDELKYWNYSLVMNKERGLAFFSAANVDADRFKGNRDADGDTWYNDTRIAADAQVGRSFYKKQKTFEADRTQSPFDQGHLTRRSDLQWGKDDDEAKRNGDESYHYTNCAPQHWQFNQNSAVNGLWFRLEELAIQAAGGKGKLCIINGPVFDAPLGTQGPEGRMRLDLKGKRVEDGKFGEVKIPKQFFKVLAYKVGNALRAKAFVVTQEDLLATIDRYYPAEKTPSVLSDLEVRLYQVKIAELEKLASLDFGTLKQHDTPAGEESTFIARGLPIQDERDLVF